MNAVLILPSKATLVGQYFIFTKHLSMDWKCSADKSLNRQHYDHIHSHCAWLKATAAKSSFVPIPVIESAMTWRPQLRPLAASGPTR
jgi:hypothetical protein